MSLDFSVKKLNENANLMPEELSGDENEEGGGQQAKKTSNFGIHYRSFGRNGNYYENDDGRRHHISSFHNEPSRVSFKYYHFYCWDVNESIFFHSAIKKQKSLRT